VETLEHYGQALSLLAKKGDADIVPDMEQIIAGMSSSPLIPRQEFSTDVTTTVTFSRNRADIEADSLQNQTRFADLLKSLIYRYIAQYYTYCVETLETQQSGGKSGKTNRKSDSKVETLKDQILRDAEIVARWSKDPFYIV